MADYSEISEDYVSDDDEEGTTSTEEGATATDEGTTVNYASPGVDGTPVMVHAEDMLSSQLLGKYQGEEFSHRHTDGLVNHPDYDRTATEYMSKEDREAFRLSVKDGKLYDSGGGLHSSDPHAVGDYPGSTGGDIFVLDQGGLFAVNQKAHQAYINQDPDTEEDTGDASGVLQQSYTEPAGDASLNYTEGQNVGGPADDGQGESLYRTVHHSTLAAGQRAAGNNSPLEVAAAGEIKTKDGEVRSISDASGHFRPTEDQTLQFVETLQNAGVNLDNTKVNLVQKKVVDMEGDLRGEAPAIDVYSGEFIASEGDQIALTTKRGVMGDLKAQFAAGALPTPDGLDDAEREAELRSQGVYNDLQAAGVYGDADGNETTSAPSLDELRAAAADIDVSQIPGAPQPSLDDLRVAAADIDVSQIPGAPQPSLDDLRAAAADIDVSQIPGAPQPSLDDLRAAAADIDVSQIPGGPRPAPGQAWQSAQPSPTARARRQS